MKKLQDKDLLEYQKTDGVIRMLNMGLFVLLSVLIAVGLGILAKSKVEENEVFLRLHICFGFMSLIMICIFILNSRSKKVHRVIMLDTIKENQDAVTLFGSILNSNNISLLYFDVSFNIIYFSKKIEKEMEFSKPFAIGMNIFELFSFSGFHQFVMKHMDKNKKESSEIITFLSEDDQQIWIWVELQTIYFQDGIQTFLLTFENVTSTFHAQTLLEASMEVTSNIILFFDNKGNLVYCSEIAAKKIGYSSRLEAVGMHFSELYTKNIPGNMIDRIKIELQSGKRFHDSCYIHSKWFNTDAVNIVITDNKYGSVVFLHDITEQVTKSQELLETIKLRERLIMTMSHEIRTPMNAILGSSELLDLSVDLLAKDRIHIRYIKEASHLLMNIIEEVTDYTKIEADEIEIIKEVFELDEMIKEVHSRIEMKAKEKDILLIIEVDSRIPRRIRGDKKRINQVLRHLLLNAIKFTSKGFVKLKIHRVDKENTMYLKYIVEDSGKGIEAEDQKKIFHSKAILSSDKDDLNLGLGLGLVICRQLVKLMGGTLSLESEKDKGCIFYFELETEKVIYYIPRNEKQQDLIFKTKDAKVLVVDDNDVNLLVAASMLKQFGVEVDQVSSGVEAVNMAFDIPYDIIFMDYLMPQMDGLEATKRIRSQHKMEQKLIIIALSANVIKDTRKIFQGEWVNDVLSKPLEIKAIATILEKWLPKEKICQLTEGIYDREDVFDAKSLFIAVDQMDYQLGLSYFAGNVEDFVKVMELSYQNMKTRLQTILDFQYVADVKDLRIDLHSIKGILLNMGAGSLSDLIYEIEKAIAENKNETVSEKLMVFIQRMQVFLKQLENALNVYTKYINTKQEEECIDEIMEPLMQEEYQKMKNDLIYYLSRYEYLEINEVLGRLIRNSTGKTKDTLLQAEVYIKNFKYEEAMEIINK